MTGAGTIQIIELNSRLDCGDVVVDLTGLRSSPGRDSDFAGQILYTMLYFIAELLPGAKLEPTAPYDRAAFMPLEVHDRPLRGLAEECPDAYLEAARFGVDWKGPPFRSCPPLHQDQLAGRATCGLTGGTMIRRQYFATHGRFLGRAGPEDLHHPAWRCRSAMHDCGAVLIDRGAKIPTIAKVKSVKVEV